MKAKTYIKDKKCSKLIVNEKLLLVLSCRLEMTRTFTVEETIQLVTEYSDGI